MFQEQTLSTKPGVLNTMCYIKNCIIFSIKHIISQNPKFCITKGGNSALRVQYDNAFRLLMGLPRYCSTSNIFTSSKIDALQAIVCK